MSVSAFQNDLRSPYVLLLRIAVLDNRLKTPAVLRTHLDQFPRSHEEFSFPNKCKKLLPQHSISSYTISARRGSLYLALTTRCRLTRIFHCRCTTTPFTELNILDGTVIGQHYQRHRQEEFISFLDHTAALFKDQEVQVVLDSYSTHKTAKVH